jgi:hypothetical protein
MAGWILLYAIVVVLLIANAFEYMGQVFNDWSFDLIDAGDSLSNLHNEVCPEGDKL